MDGNFTAQHMKMNKPELDVSLSDGTGYMVSEEPYQTHLEQPLDNKEVGCPKVLEFKRPTVLAEIHLQQSQGNQCC